MRSEVSIVNRVAVGDIIRRCSTRFPNKLALIDECNRSLTFEELEQKCNQLANYLLSTGLKKGDTVVTICRNSIEFIISMYGIVKAGLIWVPINPDISVNEKIYILERCESQLIIGDHQLLKNDIKELKQVCSSLIAIGEEGDAVGTPFHSVLNNQPITEPVVDIHERDVAQIMFTSGTTGKPKGVMISHLAIYFACLSNAFELELQKDDVGSVMMPLFHCAQHTIMTSLLNVGATVVVIEKFDPIRFMELTEKHKISWIFALPMMYRAFVEHPNRNNYDLNSIRYCMYAMAPMSKQFLEKAINELDCKFSLGSGQTEMYPATVMFKPEYQLSKIGPYWGEASMITDLAIMDDDGNLLPQGQTGEIVHRGPNVMNGYLKDEEATQNSRKFGWHHTGDLGFIDEDGLLIFVDRKKDMIKSGGENVDSIQVEHVINTNEKVEQVSVVGLPHPRWIEAVTAVVKLKPEESVSENELISFCKKYLGAFQVPKAVIFTEEFPMTSTGKIQKNILREQYRGYYQDLEENVGN
ncbi:class I adenylate-forming enzyme family protein [Alkalihalobacterium alkalinitrilicum]|uniref:class I adenylate-forming enzyme family protein n=1 Tax=Alkalihalobacterium alkalinitrilicum TaxID=427920 RepID=UPI0009955F36|nr:AMP-binding protein [Alkalihalobacterium alkalinitrilicum]